MAQFGAKRPRFAPVATQPEAALPTYNYESAVTIGKLVAANLTVTNASGELYADDALAERIDMFASGSLELQTDDKTAEVHAAIHGATLDEESDEVSDKDTDVAPAWRPRLLQGAYTSGRQALSGRVSSACGGCARQR